MHRTARVLKWLGSALVVGLLASSCVVNGDGGDDNDTCDPGTSASCTCANGNSGTKLCNATGSAYAACSCTNSSGGSGNSGGSSNAGGEPSSGGSTSAGGSTNAGGTYGSAGDTGTAGTGDGGMSAGGEGGAGNPEPQTCDQCAQAECAPEWAACGVDEGTSQCAMEYLCISGCMDSQRGDLMSGMLLTGDQITIECVEDVCGEIIPSGWGGGATQETHDLLDCLAGKTGWEEPPHWDQSECRDACFGPLP